MENIVNWCPHAIVVIDGEKKITFPKSGFVARVQSGSIEEEPTFGIPTEKVVYGKPDLGEIKEGYVYIVSAMVLSEIKRINHPQLNQFVSPNTSKSIRDEQGNIIGVPGFSV